MLLEAGDDAAARVRAAIAGALAPHLRGERVDLAASVWIATGRV
jgi:hypothetical protein